MHSIKTLTTIAVIAALIIGLSVYSTNILKNDSQQLEQKLSSVEEHTHNQNWKPAQIAITSMLNEWPTVGSRWSILLDHSEIDNIEASITRATEYIRAKNSPLALAELAYLKNQITSIPENEAFNIRNIL